MSCQNNFNKDPSKKPTEIVFNSSLNINNNFENSFKSQQSNNNNINHIFINHINILNNTKDTSNFDLGNENQIIEEITKYEKSLLIHQIPQLSNSIKLNSLDKESLEKILEYQKFLNSGFQRVIFLYRIFH